MDSLLQDVRYGLRLLVKSPGFALVAILTLAIGVGINGAIFSVVNMLLFRKLPLNLIEDPGQLVFLWSQNEPQGVFKRPASVDALAEWQQAKSFEKVFGGYRASVTLTGVKEPVRLDVFRTTPSFFSVLKVQPALGRAFLPAGEEAGADRVAILTYKTWHRYFGGDPKVLEKPLRLDGEVYQVVGVMPKDFYMPSPDVDLFTPLGILPGQRSRDDRFLMAVARLAPGVSPEQAQSEMDILSRQAAEANPDTERGWRIQVKPLLVEMYDGGVIVSAVILLIAVGLVLLLACANVGSLLLARATARSREVALRLALGCHRSRLVRQLLTESLLLALCGGAVGLLFAFGGTRLIGRISGNSTLQLAGEMGLDANILVFMILVSLFTAAAFGLFPALRASRPELTLSLKEGSKASAGRASRRSLNVIVVCEIALSLMLLVGAGLMLRTLHAWQEVDDGYDPERLLMVRVDLPEAKSGEPHQIRSYAARVTERLAALPGVEGVGIANKLPADKGKAARSFQIEGRAPAAKGEEQPWGFFTAVSPEHLQTLGVPLLQGRYLTAGDSEAAPPAVVVSKTLAQRYWASESPVGRRLRFISEGGQAQWFNVVGVVGDIEHYNVYVGPIPLFYVPLAQRPERALAITVRTAGDPARVAPEVSRALAAIDPDLPGYELQRMEELVYDNFAVLRLMTRLLGFFGLFALVLATIGIYGIISYSINQRTHEIGVRMALGALQKDVLSMVLRQAGKLALIGIALGLVGAFGLGRVMRSMLFGVSSTDPFTFAGVSLLLLSVALFASFLPGRRATRVNPVVALRME